MLCEQRLLLRCLDGDKAHRRTRSRFADRLGVGEVSLVTLDERFDKLRCDQAYLMSVRLEFARQPVRTCAGFHGDCAGRAIGHLRVQHAARRLPAPQLVFTSVLRVKKKAVLAQIDTDQRRVCHDGLPEKGNGPISVSRSGRFGQAEHLIELFSTDIKAVLKTAFITSSSPFLHPPGSVPLS